VVDTFFIIYFLLFDFSVIMLIFNQLKTIKMINTNNLPLRNTITLKPGEKVSLCRCWQSSRFPYCDGNHKKLCADKDQVGPVVVIVDNEFVIDSR